LPEQSLHTGMRGKKSQAFPRSNNRVRPLCSPASPSVEAKVTTAHILYGWRLRSSESHILVYVLTT
jgi:hypothetical protein